jgi:geranylgeranyl pyrophosphate synthase
VRVATPFEEVLSAGGEALQEALNGVEHELAAVTASYGGVLARAGGDTLSAGGKRLRPLLVFVCGGITATAGCRPLVRAGAAVELVHMASLVHDDVVDTALVRRGRPTVYAVSGRAIATATGDYLFSRAFWLLRADGDPDQIRVLADACLALARGEFVQREDAYSSDIDIDRYLHRCGLKTASLFTAACKLGALAANARPPTVEALGRFGHGIGLAFQILDDVLDVAGNPERTGKERGTDLIEGTTTLPLILAATEDPELAGIDLRSISTREDAERICDRIVSTDAIEHCRRRAGELVLTAKAELDGLEPSTRELLVLVADRVVSRYS